MARGSQTATAISSLSVEDAAIAAGELELAREDADGLAGGAALAGRAVDQVLAAAEAVVAQQVMQRRGAAAGQVGEELPLLLAGQVGARHRGREEELGVFRRLVGHDTLRRSMSLGLPARGNYEAVALGLDRPPVPLSWASGAASACRPRRSWTICWRGVNSANTSDTGQATQTVIQNTIGWMRMRQPSSGTPRVGVRTISIHRHADRRTHRRAERHRVVGEDGEGNDDRQRHPGKPEREEPQHQPDHADQGAF